MERKSSFPIYIELALQKALKSEIENRAFLCRVQETGSCTLKTFRQTSDTGVVGGFEETTHPHRMPEKIVCYKLSKTVFAFGSGDFYGQNSAPHAQDAPSGEEPGTWIRSFKHTNEK